MTPDLKDIRSAFSWRTKPASVLRRPAGRRFISSDERDALWFNSRDWRDLTWDDWQDHYRGLFFFTREALGYYIPSVLALSLDPRDEFMLAVDAILSLLAEIPRDATAQDQEENLGLTGAERKVIVRWLLHLCSLPDYESGRRRDLIERVLEATADR